MNGRTSVYRLYDASDVLLYVGISKRFGRRWEQHAKVQPWWPDVDHQTITWCATREDAELAEKRAIHDERPIHNVRDSPWEKRVKDDGTGFYVVPKPPRYAAADRHQYRAITPRLPEDLREQFQAEAEARKTTMNALVLSLLRWWLRIPGAKMPPRP